MWKICESMVFAAASRVEPRNGQNPPRQQIYAGAAGCPTALMPEAFLDGWMKGGSEPTTPQLGWPQLMLVVMCSPQLLG